MLNQKGFTLILAVLGIIVVLGLIIAAYYLGAQKIQSTHQQNSLPEPTISYQTRYVNFIYYSTDYPTPTGRIIVPRTYYVTNNEMIEPFASQGGGPLPWIILTKNYQLLDTDLPNNWFEELYLKPKNDCIIIDHNNNGYSIDNWISEHSGVFKEIELRYQEDINIGTHKATVYKMLRPEGDIYIGFLSMRNNSKATFFFQTCNINNKLDLINVIKSIEFRQDLKHT